ncbi:MAG: ATP synthase F1 subunit epsilon [Clostridiales bacterium]|nr:ATP synthase F1 subunit epsilon [Clostridiales bacterium]MBQ6270502.1 ATP synthase F1 subunit epsilon [Clostridiales bacterium]MBR4010228.1 ATP synthase F1 subunit epsilon [Clostridiales bacterium]
MADSKDQTIKKKMTLEVVNPYEVFYEGRIERIVIPTLDGQYGIMPGHAPLVIAVTPGIARFECDGESQTFAISEGFAEIGQHAVIIVCNAAEWPSEIDTERAKSALERAQARYNSVTSTEEQRLYARHAIKRAKTRLAVSAEWKNDKKKHLDQ